MPSIVPEAQEWPQYFVLCDYGPLLGRSWYEMDPEKAASKETILQWLMEGQFSDPLQILEVNASSAHAAMFRASSLRQYASRPTGIAKVTSRQRPGISWSGARLDA